MKKLTRTLLTATAGLLWALSANAQAPANNPGVMLQGFYWDSYKNGEYGCTKWSNLKSQAQEIAETFDMIWLPPSAKASGGDNGGNGYVPMTWSTQAGAWGSASELKGLISTLKQYNPDIKVIADIVVNHKAGNNIIDLNNETFKFSDGTTKSYTMYESNKKSRFICQDDEARDIYGWNPTGNPDQGYESLACEENGKKARSSSGAYCAARDLDHKNTELQEIISTYLTWLRKEIGYDGWRYDYCKGFLGGYVKTYNQAAGAYFSVGEYWDGSYDALTHWINDTGKTSNAFDFCLKYNGFNNGLASKNYSALAGYGGGSGLIGDNTYKQYAVTFVDNHDTFRDDNNKFWGDWTQANAYIIAMPGTPCVFYPHWVKCKNDIKKMAAARKACGITNTSSASCSSTGSYFRGEVTGSKGKLVVFIGSQGTCPSGFSLACSGTGWAYYTNVTVPVGPVVTMNPTSGYATSVTLSATKGTIYYTTNGTTPTASSTKYTGPIAVTSTNFTIKAIAIDGQTKSSVVSGTFTNVKPKGITVQFKAPTSWTTVKAYAWTGDGDAAIKLLGEWPGTAISKSGDKYSVTVEATAFKIIFNNGSNEQTADIGALSMDACFDGSALTYKEPWPMPGKCQDGPTPTPTTVTVRANTTNPAWSGTTYIYAWTASTPDLIGGWPGIPMTQDGMGWWMYKFTDLTEPVSVIFNDGAASGTKQTDNIENLTGDACYNILSTTHTDSWGNSVYDVSESSCPTVGVDDAESSDGVTLVPNPTSGNISILSDRDFVFGNVTSLSGKNCGTFKVYGNTLDVSNLAPSSEPYLLLLQDTNGGTSATHFYKK